ncbi:MAG: glycosyltransferase family 2 protein [Coleofasciculus chthonoplastes F3-SA18-01]|jgi:glycosyltransferase involved in cell wall biosynthesis|uniref:glycosyltransferase family 2 protein n=1 Tax=Coleofasciculus chthonoplastes TaxID=64178 RepID=UPI0032F4101B
MKLVSVIIPVYCVETYILATVKSVLNQTYKHFEVLIVDDGSTDRSIEICQTYKDSRIKIIRQKNLGVSAARNLGIRHSKGEFLAFLDGDDLWLPEKLEKHIEHLENSPHVGISYSRFTFINEAGKSLGISRLSKLKGITPALILCGNPVGNPSCTVIKREVYETLKFYSPIPEPNINCFFDQDFRHFEDVELWLRIAIKTKWQIEGIPETLTLYRVNPKGASANVYQQLKGLSMVLDKTSSYAPDLIAKYGRVTQAYTWRKLAKWAVHQRSVLTAIEMIHKALSTHWKIILEEPLRTVSTLFAICLLYFLPQSLYDKIEALALRITGSIQRMTNNLGTSNILRT